MVNLGLPNDEPIKWNNFSDNIKSHIYCPPLIRKYYYFFEKHIKSIKIISTGQKAKQINELYLPIQIG